MDLYAQDEVIYANVSASLFPIVYKSDDSDLMAQSKLVKPGLISSKNGLISSLVEHKDNSPHQCQPFCQAVMWPGGPQTLATGSEALMDRYVGAFTCPVSGRCDYFWQLVCSHSTWLEPTPEPHHRTKLLLCKQQNTQLNKPFSCILSTKL